MKKLLLVLILVFAMQYTKAQFLDVCYKPYSNGKDSIAFIAVIRPTVRNFISLLALSESEFRNKMKEYEYFETEDFSKYISYWNGGEDNMAYAHCVNQFRYNLIKDEIHFWILSDMIYPSDDIKSLYRNLKPYYKESTTYEGDPLDHFAFKLEEFAYDFLIISGRESYCIMVLRKPIS